MRNGKYAARRSSGTKAFSLMLAVLLLVGCSVGATLAWLTAQSETVTNTFTVGKVDITLQEHKYVVASNTLDTTADTVQANSYKLIPGMNMPKDPFVTVKADSEKCWLFVRIDEANLAIDASKNAVKYSLDNDAWKTLTLGEDYDDGVYVYYRIVEADTVDQNLYVLDNVDSCTTTGHTNGCVTISSDVTSAFQNTPVLKFTAAAIQYDGLALPADYNPANDEGGATFAACAKAAFDNLPYAFTSTLNLNTPVTPTPDPAPAT